MLSVILEHSLLFKLLAPFVTSGLLHTLTIYQEHSFLYSSSGYSSDICLSVYFSIKPLEVFSQYNHELTMCIFLHSIYLVGSFLRFQGDSSGRFLLHNRPSFVTTINNIIIAKTDLIFAVGFISPEEKQSSWHADVTQKCHLLKSQNCSSSSKFSGSTTGIRDMQC